MKNMKRKRQFRAIKSFLLASFFIVAAKSASAQNKSIILGRPTDNSITASILFDQSMQYYLEYGTVSGVYTNTTTTYTNTVNIPDEIDITGLSVDTKYYYRMQYKIIGAATYTATPEYTFHTQRSIGSTFSFTIEADEHLYDKKGVDNMYRVTLKNEADDNPDFMITLGDIFGDDHHPSDITSQTLDSLHKYYRPFLGNICHSVPFYDCLGNHEGEKDHYLDSMPPNNMAVYATLARKKYYPNPYPNGFYTGDTLHEGFGMGQPENYYAWTWGNALFVVLDVYRYDNDTTAKPIKWDWTIGDAQYHWLENTLQTSTAQYKFVFCHHIRGENRGGLTNAKWYEWGGYDGATGTTYSFPTKRPGWSMPIHQLFITYGVNIFFQGHDHLFAHEVLDGVTYQEVPMAADSTYKIGMLANASAYTADTIDGTGHVRVTVSPACLQVDYVKAFLPADTVSGIHHNKEIGFTYNIGSCTPTGIKENTAENVYVFPNPANDVLFIKLPDDIKQYQISIVNLLGQVVLQRQSKTIDLISIPNGVYFVNIKTSSFEVNKKIVVNR